MNELLPLEVRDGVVRPMDVSVSVSVSNEDDVEWLRCLKMFCFREQHARWQAKPAAITSTMPRKTAATTKDSVSHATPRGQQASAGEGEGVDVDDGTGDDCMNAALPSEPSEQQTL